MRWGVSTFHYPAATATLSFACPSHLRYARRMIGDLRRLIATRPFVPFTIYKGDGEHMHIATVDHIAVSPTGARIVVFADDDTVIHVSPLLVARIIVDSPVPSAATA